MKKTTLLVCAMMMATTALAYSYEPKAISLTGEERELVMNNNDFAFNLFRKAREGKSMVLSPLSVTYALGMLSNGATGETLQEIIDGTGVGNTDAINTLCKKITEEAATLDDETKMRIANNIYFNQKYGYRLAPTFVEKAAEYYGVTPEVSIFNESTRNTINQWASRQTEGMIPEILSSKEFSKDALNYLLNAIYFKSKWTSPFEALATKEDDFYHEDGDKETVKMMGQISWFPYSENDVYQSVVLPYGNGAYQMTIFLPIQGRTIDDVLETLDGHNWNDNDCTREKVWLRMPRFETETEKSLTKILTGLGISRAFDAEEAQFYDMCDNVTDGNNIYISGMKQMAKIKVTEDGTEAAAVTVTETLVGCAPGVVYIEPKNFFADHPFLYVISEKSSGIILFMGQYLGEDDGSASPAAMADGNNEDTAIDDLQEQKEDCGDTAIYDLYGRKLNNATRRGLYINGSRKYFKK